jgi:hypothetical protein
MGDPMSEHPNVTTVNRMTKAILDQDRETLAEIFTEDLLLHLTGPLPRAGDHYGVDGLLEVIGNLFEVTQGDLSFDQRFCLGTDGWAAEFERTEFGRGGEQIGSHIAFIYRFDEARIAEMWMLPDLPPSSAAFFE